MLWPGNAVNSVQKLRQRLQDIDLDQITDAAERLSELRARLSDLHRSLWVVTEVSACRASVHQAQDRVRQELHRLQAQILEALDGLRRKDTIDNVLALCDFQSDSVETNDKTRAADSQLATTLESSSSEPEDVAQVESDQAALPDHEILQGTGTSTLTDTVIPEDRPPDLVAGVTDNAAKYDDPTAEPPIFGSAERPDFGFLKGVSGPSPEFDFHDDVLEPTKNEIFPEPCELINSHAAASQQEAPVAAADTADFDKKLLDDLIKNYGEFAVIPDLPASVDPPNPSEKLEPSWASQTTGEADASINRSLAVQQNHGEFDRKLKKLIKDYGQVDLYSQHSSGKTKLRTLGAFAVLGAVLSGIYYFSAPKAAVVPESAATPTRASDASGATTTDSSDSIDQKTAGSVPIVGHVPPQTVEASESFDVSDKQGLKKTIKKGGSQQ